MYIEPGAPRQNPYVESFNGKVRDELLDIEEFSWLAEARVVIEDWPRGLQPPQATQLARDAIPAAFAATAAQLAAAAAG